MTFEERQQLRQLVDRAKRDEIDRAHGRDVTPADLRAWERAERAERLEAARAAREPA